MDRRLGNKKMKKKATASNEKNDELKESHPGSRLCFIHMVSGHP